MCVCVYACLYTHTVGPERGRRTKVADKKREAGRQADSRQAAHRSVASVAQCAHQKEVRQ